MRLLYLSHPRRPSNYNSSLFCHFLLPGTKNRFVCLLIEPWESPNSFLKTQLKNRLWVPLPGFPNHQCPGSQFIFRTKGCECKKETPGSFSKERAGWVDNGGRPSSPLAQCVTRGQCGNTCQAILWKVCQSLGEGRLV